MIQVITHSLSDHNVTFSILFLKDFCIVSIASVAFTAAVSSSLGTLLWCAVLDASFGVTWDFPSKNTTLMDPSFAITLLYATTPYPVFAASAKIWSSSSPSTVFSESHALGMCSCLKFGKLLAHKLKPSFTDGSNFLSQPQFPCIDFWVQLRPIMIFGAISPSGSNKLACSFTRSLVVCAGTLNFSSSIATESVSFSISQAIPSTFCSLFLSSVSLLGSMLA